MFYLCLYILPTFWSKHFLSQHLSQLEYFFIGTYLQSLSFPAIRLFPRQPFYIFAPILFPQIRFNFLLLSSFLPPLFFAYLGAPFRSPIFFLNYFPSVRVRCFPFVCAIKEAFVPRDIRKVFPGLNFFAFVAFCRKIEKLRIFPKGFYKINSSAKLN